MVMMSNKKNSKDVKEFSKASSNSRTDVSGETSGSTIYEAGKAYYEFLQNVKSQSFENDCDYSTAFMMF